jgi:exodeoxyribonuclease V alpha subunit
LVVLEDTPLVTREWLYTAITRARERVVIIGSKSDLEKAVERRTKRTTGFRAVWK